MMKLSIKCGTCLAIKDALNIVIWVLTSDAAQERKRKVVTARRCKMATANDLKQLYLYLYKVYRVV